MMIENKAILLKLSFKNFANGANRYDTYLMTKSPRKIVEKIKHFEKSVKCAIFKKIL